MYLSELGLRIGPEAIWKMTFFHQTPEYNAWCEDGKTVH